MLMSFGGIVTKPVLILLSESITFIQLILNCFPVIIKDLSLVPDFLCLYGINDLCNSIKYSGYLMWF